MFELVLNTYLILLLKFLSYMVFCILFCTSAWPQDHILYIECVNLLSLSFILFFLVDINIEIVKTKVSMPHFPSTSQCEFPNECGLMN